MEKLQFKLEKFEGPLDLLLHLISKHKLNIYDIEISSLLEQYLNYINDMKAADMEVASEFLEMAARLVYMKTCSLLPEDKEEQEQLKRELTGQLLELQMVKLAAQQLSQLSLWGQIFSRVPEKLEPSTEGYSHHHEPEEIRLMYQVVLNKVKRLKPPPKSAFSGIVEHKVVSITSRVMYVLRQLYKNGKMPYQDFFSSGERSEMVATFLAMLELIKSKRIKISSDNQYVLFDRTKQHQS